MNTHIFTTNLTGFVSKNSILAVFTHRNADCSVYLGIG